MQIYSAPLRDMRFVLHELFADDQFDASAAFDQLRAAGLRVPAAPPPVE